MGRASHQLQNLKAVTCRAPFSQPVPPIVLGLGEPLIGQAGETGLIAETGGTPHISGQGKTMQGRPATRLEIGFAPHRMCLGQVRPGDKIGARTCRRARRKARTANDARA